MPRRRIYLPLTRVQLDALAAGREVGPAPLIGYAAPVGLAPSLVEDAEHAAWCAAAAAAAEQAAGGRRVIGSADVDGALVEPVRAIRAGSEPVEVEIDAPVALRRFVAFHVDEEAGGSEADLLWYDVTELADVRALLQP